VSTASDDDEDEPVIRKRMPVRRVWPGGGREQCSYQTSEGSISLPDWERSMGEKGSWACHCDWGGGSSDPEGSLLIRYSDM
jgi:hypothetical protein